MGDTVILGEASESDSEEIPLGDFNINPVHQGIRAEKSVENSRRVISTTNLSPLHKSLIEKNIQLNNNLRFLTYEPYSKAIKNLNSISQKLVISQRIILGLDDSVQQMSNNLQTLQQLINSDNNP